MFLFPGTLSHILALWLTAIPGQECTEGQVVLAAVLCEAPLENGEKRPAVTDIYTLPVRLAVWIHLLIYIVDK